MDNSRLPIARTLFTLIYFIEGLITSLFGLSFLYLTGIGISPASLSVVILIALVPLFFKPFAGVLTDRSGLGGSGGRRKPWLLIGIGLQAAGFFGLAVVDPTAGLHLYMLGMGLAVAALVLYDTCADGLALDLLRPEQYSEVQSWMTIGRYSAVLVVPPAATGLAATLGWPVALAALGLLSLLPVPFILALKEPAATVRPKQVLLPVLRKVLVVPGVFICLLGFLTMLATSGTEEIWLGYLRDSVGVPLGVVGWFGTIFGVGVIAGAVVGVRLTRALGRVASNYVTIALIALSATLLVAASGTAGAIAAAVAFGLAMGVLHVTVFSLGMTLRVPGAEATSFAVFSVFLVTGTVVGMAVSPWLVDRFDYSWTFVLNGLAGCAGAVMVWLLRDSEVRMTQPLEISAGRH